MYKAEDLATMWAYHHEKKSTNMTVVLGVLQDAGISVYGDTLSLAVKKNESGRLYIDSVDRQRKIFPIGKHAVIGFSCKAFELELLEPFANMVKTLTEQKPYRSVRSLANLIAESLKTMMAKKSGASVEVLIAGYDYNAHNQPTRPRLYILRGNAREITMEAISDRFTSVGAALIISSQIKLLKERSQIDLLRQRVSSEEAEYYSVELLKQCSLYEEMAMAAKDKSASFHVGGKIEKLEITKKGIAEKDTQTELPIRIEKGELLYPYHEKDPIFS